MKLLLFDIDGTLLGSRTGIGRHALEMAFRKVIGRTVEIPLARCAGRPDPYIVDKTFEAESLPVDPRTRADVLREYIKILERDYSIENGAFAYPGVERLLEELGRRADTVTGLLTGNVREGARIKLSVFDLWKYFAVGAFGSDSDDRAALPPIAIKRAQDSTGHRYAPRDVYVIGDTIHDVRAGQAHSLVTIAVGTHQEWVDEMIAARPDHFLSSLADFDGFIAAIDGERQPAV
ncbi:MAG: haloacid dehalogenase-like hydrolase [Acidobacteriota bacterium]